MLSEISQIKKDKFPSGSHLYAESKNQKKKKKGKHKAKKQQKRRLRYGNKWAAAERRKMQSTQNK